MTQTQSLIPNLGIDQKITKSAATSLIQIFSDQLALYLKTYNFSFNVIGPRFHQTHSCLCKQSDKLSCLTECTANQIRQLGYRVPTLAEVMKNTQIAPQKTDFVDEDSMMKALLQDHEAFIVFLGREREKIANLPELVVEDFILDQLKVHRIMAWDLRAQLERLEGNMSFAVPTGMVSQHTQGMMGTQMGTTGQYGQPSTGMMGTPMSTSGQSPYGTQQQGVGMGSQSYGTMGTQMGSSGQFGQQSTGMDRPSTMGTSGTQMGSSGQYGQPTSTGMTGQTGMEGYSREQQAWGQPTGMDRPSMGQTSGMGQTTTGMTGSSTGPSSSSSSSTGMGQPQQRKM